MMQSVIGWRLALRSPHKRPGTSQACALGMSLTNRRPGTRSDVQGRGTGPTQPAERNGLASLDMRLRYTPFKLLTGYRPARCRTHAPEARQRDDAVAKDRSRRSSTAGGGKVASGRPSRRRRRRTRTGRCAGPPAIRSPVRRQICLRLRDPAHEGYDLKKR